MIDADQTRTNSMPTSNKSVIDQRAFPGKTCFVREVPVYTACFSQNLGVLEILQEIG